MFLSHRPYRGGGGCSFFLDTQRISGMPLFVGCPQNISRLWLEIPPLGKYSTSVLFTWKISVYSQPAHFLFDWWGISVSLGTYPGLVPPPRISREWTDFPFIFLFQRTGMLRYKGDYFFPEYTFWNDLPVFQVATGENETESESIPAPTQESLRLCF